MTLQDPANGLRPEQEGVGPIGTDSGSGRQVVGVGIAVGDAGTLSGGAVIASPHKVPAVDPGGGSRVPERTPTPLIKPPPGDDGIVGRKEAGGFCLTRWMLLNTQGQCRKNDVRHCPGISWI